MAHPPKSTDFLKNLNPAQRKAVEKIYGPVLVLAGPGTGKTHLLTTRISFLLDQKIGTEPHNILCLTFTESGASQMRTRLQKLIGNEAYKVKISTFHGFCQWVMDEYPQYFSSVQKNREIADDLQKALAFQETIQSKKWEFFSNVWDDFLFRNDVLKSISHLKRENISIDIFRKMVPSEKERLESEPDNFYKRKFGMFDKGDFKPQKREEIDRKIRRMFELADFWEAYETNLSDRGFFDFDDQLMWVVKKVKTETNLRLDLAERFQWVMVDEYQDTNSAQNQLLWALSDYENSPNIFSVGDDDQAIYRFQGASVENIFEFQKKFPNHEKITLSENYRSGQNILDGAFACIEKNIHRADPEKKLTASGINISYSGKITKAVFGARLSELGFLVSQIQELLKKNIPSGEIAILCRKNSEVKEIARELPKFGIPVSAHIFQNIFEHEWVRILILILEILSNPNQDEKLFSLLHVPFWEIDKEVLFDLSLRKNDEKKSSFTLLKQEAINNSQIQKVLDFLMTSRQKFWHCRPEVLVQKLLYESGLAKYLTRKENEQRNVDWQMIRKFNEWISMQQCSSLSDILKRIELHQKLHIPLSPDPLPSDQKAVQIMTVHQSKGQEFDVVFIPGLLDRAWGNNINREGIPLPHIFKETHDGNEDERRLFFVALTRARKEIFLSFSTTDFSGREKNPSQFWHEIPEEKCFIFPQEEGEERVQKLLPVFLSLQKNPLFTQQEKDILSQRVKNFAWSASSLNAYIACPRKFLYQNILRFPRKPLPRLALGVALHEALERSLKILKSENIFPNLSHIHQEYERALRGQNLEKQEYEKILEHGKELLELYFQKRIPAFSPDSLIEFDIQKYNPEIDGIRITGKIDRVDFLNTEKTKAKIVDYKSGKPRSIKKRESLWRQLVFYDLLVKQSEGISWEVDRCELEFLTPDSQGVFRQRSWEVSDQDREMVIQELKECHEKVQNLEFRFVPNLEQDQEIDYWQSFGT
jgi:DNA helicase-2/ATP-dependent DNA helicase PcrA